MSDRGKSLLAAIGMDKGEGSDDSEPESSLDTDDDYSGSEGETAAAEKLCRLLGVSEDKATKVAKAICDFLDSRGG